MPQKENQKKVIQFPVRNKTKEQPHQQASPLSELIAAMSAADAVKQPGSELSSPSTPAPVANSVVFNIAINGGVSQISTDGVFHATGSQAAPFAAVTVPDVPAEPLISFAQKRQLRDLRDEIVDIAINCGFKKHPATVMVSLNTYMGVEKYDQIRMNDFDMAQDYLQTQKDALSSYSAHIQQIADLRRQIFDAINLHGRVSIRQLLTEEISTTQLEDLYRTVISEK